MKKSLIILTNKFPYEGGEQFIEPEIKYWKNSRFDKIYIMPHSDNILVRSYPPELTLINKSSEKLNFTYGILSLITPLLYKEIFYIIKKNKPNYLLKNTIAALRTTALTLKTRRNLSQLIKTIKGDEITIYSYWNDSTFYAACLLKRKGLVHKVVSRAHGFDIYRDRRFANYMPLKRQFMHDFDKVFLLSKSAFSYYKNTYNVSSEHLAISRLGVDIPLRKPTSNYKDDSISILSLSNCNEVKQIHKIIDAMYDYAKKNPSYSVTWTHIGDGELFNALHQKSQMVANSQENLSISFLGELKNIEVHEHLQSTYHDVFINTSKSEGIPVSIMEAMSYGIPAIAPDIGGIADLVNTSNGHLMPKKFSTKNIIEGIDKIHNSDNYQLYRTNASQWINENFNASINYPKFIKNIEEISKI